MNGKNPKRTKMLSATQVDILRHLASDEDYASVARKLAMTSDGVQYHLTQIRRLLQMKSIPAIIALAIVSGVLTADQWPIEATGDLFIDL